MGGVRGNGALCQLDPVAAQPLGLVAEGGGGGGGRGRRLLLHHCPALSLPLLGEISTFL